jgi:hypothetical protein
MQIHEITQKKINQVDEGLLDTVKSAFTGAKAGYKASQGNRAVQAIANKAYPMWLAYEKRLAQSITDPTAKQAFDNRTDGLYQRALTAFVQQNFLKNVRIDDTINKDQLKDLIQKLSEPKIAVTAPKPTATPAPASAQPSTIVDPATNKPFSAAPVSEALDATTEKQLFTQLVQVASLAQPDAERDRYQPAVQLVSRDPAIVKFDGRTYGLNDRGEWHDIKNSKVPEEAVQEYLNKIAGI